MLFKCFLLGNQNYPQQKRMEGSLPETQKGGGGGTGKVAMVKGYKTNS